MSIQPSDYDAVLAEYTSRDRAISLLKEHRPYLETIPSMRRSQESIITIPLPLVRLRNSLTDLPKAIQLPCDLAIITCDPEWRIKMGVEIFVFIHRPEEDFFGLLSRWRQIQVLLDRDYEWLISDSEQRLFSETTDKIYPLFVVFENSPVRIKKGLAGASLPFVVRHSDTDKYEELAEIDRNNAI